jgi:hypothetical protein
MRDTVEGGVGSRMLVLISRELELLNIGGW